MTFLNQLSFCRKFLLLIYICSPHDLKVSLNIQIVLFRKRPKNGMSFCMYPSRYPSNCRCVHFPMPCYNIVFNILLHLQTWRIVSPQYYNRCIVCIFTHPVFSPPCVLHTFIIRFARGEQKNKACLAKASFDG